jgi:hypothetical protein
MTKAKYHKRWLVQAVSGLLLTSAGLCMTIEAGFLKSDGVSLLEWILAGTVSLIVFNAGLCLLIDSLRFRMLRDAADD